MAALLQISDTHFGTERPAVVEALEELVRQIAPELVVLSGDITQRATRRQFAAARAFCDRLAPVPVLAIPGNHDVPLFNLFARFFAPYARYQAAFGPVLEPLHNSPHWLVVGVKSTRRWRHKHGEVSLPQVARVEQHLRRATPAQTRLVVLHQPMAVPDPHETHNLLRGRDAAIRRWADAGADMVLGGHIHLPGVMPLHHAQPALARPLWCVLAGTALSSRVRPGAGNSVNVLHPPAPGAGRQARVERWDYADAQQEFTLAGRHVLDLASGAAGGG